ncbi:MAG TPA: hypothetical protein VN176_06550 [Verrucomicrobiae bacterium]|jgi:hypothetical protein|nr:hypothetical protein [Verrucomicrobiae bacterium]
MTTGDLFRGVSGAFEQAGIPYMLVGSFASSVYGAGRATQDVDFLVAANADKIKAFLNLLPPSDYYFDLQDALQALKHSSMFNLIDKNTGFKIDIIFQKPTAFNQEEFRRRTQADVEGVRLFVATAEDVVLSKLEWAKLGESSRQIEDVAGILKARGSSLDRVYVEKWVKEMKLSSEWDRALQSAGLD